VASAAAVRVVGVPGASGAVEVARGTLGAEAAMVPLALGGQELGLLAVDGGLASDRGLLAEVAGRAAVALENARLHEQDRTIAHALQRSLLDVPRPQDPRCRIATHYEAGVRALEVGGDWHDAFLVGPDVVGLVVGDVVGRGLTAASAMGQLRSAVRALAQAGHGPAHVLEQLDVFVEEIDDARMATVVYAEVDLAGGRVRHASAGHPPPVRVPLEAPPRLLLGGRSAPLGAHTHRTERPQAETVLACGERLLLYTDGVVERRGEPIDDGVARLVEAVERSPGLSCDALVARVRGELVPAEPDDDTCLLCFERA
jgi:serine/threonine-protein kinase RsbW